LHQCWAVTQFGQSNTIALFTSLILLYSPLGFLPSFFEKWKTSFQEFSSKGLLQKEKGDHSLGWILSRITLILQLLPSWIATKGVFYMAMTLKIGSRVLGKPFLVE
jgi:hypothetical protein